MDFESWLRQELDKEVSDYYDPNGNSARAVVIRKRKGWAYSLNYEFKEVIQDIKTLFTYYWKGFNTPIVWFLQAALIPVLITCGPFVRTHSRYKRAINEYKFAYSKADYYETTNQRK